MKKFLAIIIVLILVFVLGFFWLNRRADLSKTPSDAVDRVTYAMETEDGLSFPKITGFHDEAIMSKVNSELAGIKSKLNCGSLDDLKQALRSGFGGADSQHSEEEIAKMDYAQALEALGWYYQVDPQVTYAKNDIFSIHLTYGLYCGGAHPANGDASENFDLKTGEQIPFAKLFSDFENQKDEIAKILLAEYKKLPGEKEDYCTELDPENFEYASYYVSPEGQPMIIPALPQVISVCSQDVPIPLPVIQKFLPADSFLFRLNNN